MAVSPQRCTPARVRMPNATSISMGQTTGGVCWHAWTRCQPSGERDGDLGRAAFRKCQRPCSVKMMGDLQFMVVRFDSVMVSYPSSRTQYPLGTHCANGTITLLIRAASTPHTTVTTTFIVEETCPAPRSGPTYLRRKGTIHRGGVGCMSAVLPVCSPMQIGTNYRRVLRASRGSGRTWG